MRLKLVLLSPEQKTDIPINYQYALSSAIYGLLRHSAPAFAAWLHNHGYLNPSGRPMKLFTFSRLWIPNVEQRDDRLAIPPGAKLHLQIASPMLSDFLQPLVEGLFLQQVLTIADKQGATRVRVVGVEVLPEPSFTSPQRFRCLSPIVVKTVREYQGKRSLYYYRPEDPDLGEALRHGLLRKHRAAYQKAPADTNLTFGLEPNDRPRSRLVTIKKGTPEETRIKAFETWFTLEGSTELMRTAYECGLGDHTSQGFGMIEVAGGRKPSVGHAGRRAQP